MHIAFVNSTRGWGGVKTWCLDMAGEALSQGHRAHIYGRAGSFVDKALAQGIPARAVRFGPDCNPLTVAWFAMEFRRQDVEQVVVNIAKDMRTAGLAAALLGLPVCQHVGAVGDLTDTWRLRLTRRLVRPRLVACSDYVRRGLLDSLPWLRPGEVAAIHPGVRPAAQAPTQVGSPPRIAVTSRLDPDKAHAELLPALALLAAEGLDFRVVVAGTGRCETELKAQATALGLDDRLQWAGFVADVPGLLAGADIHVLPSLAEPLGIALQEAMAAGCVPVARRAGGVPEIWPAGMEAQLFAPQDGTTGMAASLRRLLTLPPAELLALKRRTWEHARTAFSLDGQCRRFLEWLAQGRRSA